MGKKTKSTIGMKTGQGSRSQDRAEELALLGAWTRAHDELAAIDKQGALNGDRLELMATAAYMTGREDEYIDLLSRAFAVFTADAAMLRAARAAFWIGLTLMFAGETGRGGGWLSRSERLIHEHGSPCAEYGYLLLPRAEASLSDGDLATAGQLASEAAAIGERFGDDDLIAMARHLVGRTRMSSGAVREGLALLDETMIAATEDRLAPIVTGLIYCSVIEACQKFQIYDRASEWTDALSRWCERQPELVAFTGRCLIHRAEVMIFDGKWQAAIAEADAACKRLIAGGARHHAGPAYYQAGEAMRLRGKFSLASEYYRAASQLGHNPQPGLALMNLSQGKSATAWTGIRRCLASSNDPLVRMRILPAAVEIALSAGEAATAGAHCAELSDLANRYASGTAEATAAEALGDLSLAQSDAGTALQNYSRAAAFWHEMCAPYHSARLRWKTGRACDKLGDRDGALNEMEAARDAFEALGAEPDRIAAVAALRRLEEPRSTLLTKRQIEVLDLVASGHTNREIASELAISERTVDRHVSDILTRIDVPTRAAACAFAVKNGLIAPKETG